MKEDYVNASLHISGNDKDDYVMITFIDHRNNTTEVKQLTNLFDVPKYFKEKMRESLVIKSEESVTPNE